MFNALHRPNLTWVEGPTIEQKDFQPTYLSLASPGSNSTWMIIFSDSSKAYLTYFYYVKNAKSYKWGSLLKFSGKEEFPFFDKANNTYRVAYSSGSNVYLTSSSNPQSTEYPQLVGKSDGKPYFMTCRNSPSSFLFTYDGKRYGRWYYFAENITFTPTNKNDVNGSTITNAVRGACDENSVIVVNSSCHFGSLPNPPNSQSVNYLGRLESCSSSNGKADVVSTKYGFFFAYYHSERIKCATIVNGTVRFTEIYDAGSKVSDVRINADDHSKFITWVTDKSVTIVELFLENCTARSPVKRLYDKNGGKRVAISTSGKSLWLVCWTEATNSDGDDDDDEGPKPKDVRCIIGIPPIINITQNVTLNITQNTTQNNTQNNTQEEEIPEYFELDPEPIIPDCDYSLVSVGFSCEQQGSYAYNGSLEFSGNFFEHVFVISGSLYVTDELVIDSSTLNLEGSLYIRGTAFLNLSSSTLNITGCLNVTGNLIIYTDTSNTLDIPCLVNNGTITVLNNDGSTTCYSVEYDKIFERFFFQDNCADFDTVTTSSMAEWIWIPFVVLVLLIILIVVVMYTIRPLRKMVFPYRNAVNDFSVTV